MQVECIALKTHVQLHLVKRDQNNIGGNPPNTYMFKVNNRNTTTKLEICSNDSIKTPEWRH